MKVTSEGNQYMGSTSKAKGTAAETAVVDYLREHGWPHVERRAANGRADRGDIAGVVDAVIEVKNCARLELAAWIDEAELERRNDRSSHAAVVHKRRGKGNPADWFVTMTGAQYVQLLRAAGYGPPLAPPSIEETP
jgi:hypothetical protein